MPADTIAPASAAETPHPLTLRTLDLHNQRPGDSPLPVRAH
jgi:hypothetical protein